LLLVLASTVILDSASRKTDYNLSLCHDYVSLIAVYTENSFTGSRVITYRDVDIPTGYRGEPNWLEREISLARE
jgi:hypothetical protein